MGTRLDVFHGTADLLLGHRRLSILDTSPLGHQPMSNASGSIWITYNGEIYNYLELKAQLKRLGYAFRTRTDTEVLLAAYEEWGEECLRLLNGMWSFVIYDSRTNVLFGARDRFGVKPFYYYMNGETFVFASEIKAIVQAHTFRREVNAKAVFDYLVLGYQETEEEGFFKNILELSPSCAFRYDLTSGAIRKWQYYTLEYNGEWETCDERKLKDYVSRVRDQLWQAISLRLRSDVPIGSCLSGGMDSSAIVCIINKLLEGGGISQIGERQKVFTAVYEHDKCDEGAWAAKVVEQSRTSWYRTYPKADELLGDLEDLVYTQDVPFYSTSVYAQFRVMRLVRESGIKVLLDGQGGDELLSGYPHYHTTFALEMLRHWDIAGFISEWKNIGNSPLTMSQLAMRMLRTMGARVLPCGVRREVIKAMKNEHRYLVPEFWRSCSSRLNLIEAKLHTCLNQSLQESMTRFDLKALLRYEDRNSMRYSVESRTPFADDRDLIEGTFSIPSAYKIHAGWSKYLLREAMKGIVPEVIRRRTDKVGFATPEKAWLSEAKDALRQYISRDLGAFVDVKRLLRDWDSLLMRDASGAGIADVWRIVNLAIWKRVYGV
jgi:asparagine synthase (glutamine-hydrolysing)